MLQNIKQLHGATLSATDGHIGQVKDFYFDDETWAIRYLVIDTGSWLPGREVLLSPHAFKTHPFNGGVNRVQVDLTRKQIEDSPSIDLHRPVSRQYEEEYYRYYGWPSYWQEGGTRGVAGFPVATSGVRPGSPAQQGHNHRADTHLRSVKAVTGYSIEAKDSPIGTVSGFMVDGKTWTLRELTVETGHWNAGKRIFLLTEGVDLIGYPESTVFVKHARNDIMKTAKDHVAHAAVAHA